MLYHLRRYNHVERTLMFEQLTRLILNPQPVERDWWIRLLRDLHTLLIVVNTHRLKTC